jgi:hypothetical protein
MRDTIDMAREAWKQSGEGWVHPDWFEDRAKALKAFEALVRADERSVEREGVEDLLKEYDMANSAFAKDFRARGNT